MEKYTKRFSVEEVQEILNKHMGVKDTRIHCLTSHNGMNWDGIQVSVYDENATITKKEIGALDKRSADIDREFFGDDGF